MPLTEGDYEDLRAESQAEPERFANWDPNERFKKEYAALHPENQEQENEKPDAEGPIERDENEIERLPTASSSSSSEDGRPGMRRRATSSYSHDTDLHRSETNRINRDLETHPTALDRIITHRSQHFGTVGSRVSTKKRKEHNLPKFGGGKPYPPPLPKQEEYVVEFDGHDDPTHAQNWPFKKKYVY
jgi:DHA1 family multidrug resistance protein-like MFS transporter